MDRASEIKRLVTMQDIIRKYGFETNRSGFMRCPFHQGDHTASLKIYPGDRGWCCFGCHRGGTVIDFVMNLFGISFQQALSRINFDFDLGLSASNVPNIYQNSKFLQEMLKEKKETEKFRSEYQSRTILFRRMWWSLKSGLETPLYFMALRELPMLENWFDENPWR